jgi:pyridoxamine 5'-phosphate oxidase
VTTFDGRRSEYDRGALTEADLAPDPIAQLMAWLDDARDAGAIEHTAMSVSTVDGEGRPSSRVVLLRGIVDDGLVFFTSYESDKARDLERQPECAALFSWLEIQRQVRVTGRAERLDEAASDEYFASRPRGSQIGAWASPQSQVIADRAELEAQVTEVEARFADGEVPRPPSWGGYRIVGDSFEFWQGRPSRLHDRLRYRRRDVGDLDAGWLVERLAP